MQENQKKLRKTIDMKDRIFAIVNENELAKADVLQIVDSIKLLGNKITIFSTKPESFYNDADTVMKLPGCEIVQIPVECNSRPKTKNFVVNHFKKSGFKGYLHELEDSIEMLKDPIKFIADIENMMRVFDLHNWCGTVTDCCNYVYSKYNPRLSVKIDKPEYSKLNIDDAVFCSHANVQWLIYDLENADDDELFFNDKFTIDMFWIIEFLARRRNTHPDSLYFMNQYFTCASEKGIYKLKDDQKKREAEDLQTKMKEEDLLFKSMKINYAPDNNIDRVLELLYSKLESKIK